MLLVVSVSFLHAFNPFDLVKGEKLYPNQFRLVNDVTAFVGQRNACKDIVHVGFLSFNICIHEGSCAG